jgi:membrane protein involved in colicin uptake
MLKPVLLAYHRYLGASLLVHAVFLGFLIFSLGGASPVHQGDGGAKPVDIVEAIAVDEEKIKTEVERLQVADQQQKQATEEQQRQLIKKTEQLKEREKELVKLDQLKRDMAKAKAEEESKLAEIKIEKEKEKKQLEVLQKAKEKEKKDIAALEDERQVEKERVRQLKVAQEKEVATEAAAKKKSEESKKIAAQKASEEAERAAGVRKAALESKAGAVARLWGQGIREYRREFDNLPANTECTLRVRMLPDGRIDVRLEKSSGNAMYDDACVKATYKNQPFPTHADPLVMEELKSFTVTVKNRD